MEPGKLKVVKDFHIVQNRPAAAIEGLPVNSDDQKIIGPTPVRRGLRLDVDEILKRSLPDVSQLAVGRRINN